MFINNNYRFHSLCIWKVLSTFLEECKYAKTSVKTNCIDKELKLKSDSDSDSDTDSDIYIKE